MINKKYLKLQRSRKNLNLDNFLYKTISKTIIDSLDLLNVSFSQILELGFNDNEISSFIKKKYPKSNLTMIDLYLPKKLKDKEHKFLEMDLDKWILKKNFYDLIFSNLYIHLTDNFNMLIKNIHESLKPGGFFIASIPDINNLNQLVNSMYKTDLELYNGAYQRINPSQNIEKVISLLKDHEFDIPTVNSDKIKIEYNKFQNLLKDMSNMRLSYCKFDKKNKFENKKYFNFLEKNYKKDFYDGNFILDIKLNIISAWKK